MKHALLVASLVLAGFVPAATADISILGGTAILHTNGDPGVSVAGSPVARVAPAGSCDVPNRHPCVAVYGDPGNLVEYHLAVHNGMGTCGESVNCLFVKAASPLFPFDIYFLYVVADDDSGRFFVCSVLDCLYVKTAPLCVGTYGGEIICET